MILSLVCLAFPLLLLYAAWHDVSTMWIPNWVSIALALAFIPAALAAGLSLEQVGQQFVFAAVVTLACAALFFLGVFGGGDAKVISAASLWIGFAGLAPFIFWMAIAGGGLALSLLVLRRMQLSPSREWSKRLLSSEIGAPYAVAIAAGAFIAAPASPVLSAALATF